MAYQRERKELRGEQDGGKVRIVRPDSGTFLPTIRRLTHELETAKRMSHQVSVTPFGILWNSVQLHFSGHCLWF